MGASLVKHVRAVMAAGLAVLFVASVEVATMKTRILLATSLLVLACHQDICLGEAVA